MEHITANTTKELSNKVEKIRDELGNMVDEDAIKLLKLLEEIANNANIATLDEFKNYLNTKEG